MQFSPESINSQLFELYSTWERECFPNLARVRLVAKEYNWPQMLRIFSASYFERRIMIFGKEAHDTKSIFPGEETFAPLSSFENEIWEYDHQIVTNTAANTFYLKTRKLICGISDEDDIYKRKSNLFSVLPNNLNKLSIRGKHERYNGLAASLGVYSRFEFDGQCGNIFDHELLILKPERIVLLCGMNYDNHIKRALGNDFYDCMIRARNEVDFRINKDVSYTFETSQYKAIHCIHPSAHMNKESRERYNEQLRDFCS